MKLLMLGAAIALPLIIVVACDAPNVRIPAKPRVDADDLDDEAEELTYGQACTTDADCPGTENDVCSARLGCVECTSDAHCDADESCIVAWGDCESLSRRR